MNRSRTPFEKMPALVLLMTLGWVCGVEAATSGDATEAPATWLDAQPGSAAKSDARESSAEVQVILSGPSRRLAVINGEVVKVGDIYKGSKVVAIRGDKLVLEDASKSLAMTPGVSKAKPVLSRVQKKRVVLPDGDVSPKAIGSK